MTAGGALSPMRAPEISTLLLTFACGAAYELGCVFWVHYSETNRAGLAVFWSCFNALVTVVGLGEALHRPAFIAVYVSGYGFGTYVAIKMKTRWAQKH
jgi:uncharacterized protein YebE (UPF0316 family)